MQNEQIVQINISLENLQRFSDFLHDESLTRQSCVDPTHLHADVYFFRGYFSFYLNKYLEQPDGVGRSPVPSSGAVGQENNQ